MTNEEKLKSLLDTGQFEFLKNIPKENIWKLIFAIIYIEDAVPMSVIEDIKAEIESICENTTYPPNDTFFREVVDEDYFFGLEYAIKIIDKHIGKEN